jgi:hypothetical protein
MTIPSTNIFLENWDTLPNELKLHILCHAVYSKRFIRSYDFLPYNIPLYLLLSITVLKNMVMEAFYGNNLMYIIRSCEHPLREDMDILRYPSAFVAPFVRQLRIFSCGTLSIRKMTIWAKIADGTLRFKNLCILYISTSGTNHSEHGSDFLDALRNFPQMAFPTRQLQVEYWRPEYANTREFDQDNIAAPFLEKFTLRSDQPVHELWTRYYWYTNGERSRDDLISSYCQGDGSKTKRRMVQRALSSELPGPEVRSVWHGVTAVCVCVSLIVCLPLKDYKTHYYHLFVFSYC